MGTIARQTVARQRVAKERQERKDWERDQRQRWHESRRQRYGAAIAAVLEALADDLAATPVVHAYVRAVEQRSGVSFADMVAHARFLAGWDE